MMVCVPSLLSWRPPNLVIEETVDADLEAAGHPEPLTLALPVAEQPGPGRARAARTEMGQAGPTYQREREYLVLARVLLAQDRPAQAVALLERLYAAAAAQNRAGSVIETRALRALALAASGEEAGAVDVLAGVLTLACPQGYARVFADEGPPMGALPGRLVAAQKTEQAAARGVSPPCLARLLRVFGQGAC